MNHDAMILRAMLRLARRRQEGDEAAIALRAGGSGAQVRAAMRRLEARGLLVRSADRARLTMQGLAVAVAMLPAAGSARAAASSRASKAA